MLKDLPFELLVCDFDDFCNMGPGVMKEFDLTLLIGPYQLNSLFHMVQLSYVELFVDRNVSFKHFAVYHALLTPPNENYGLLWMEIKFDIVLRYLLEPTTPFFASNKCISTIPHLLYRFSIKCAIYDRMFLDGGRYVEKQIEDDFLCFH